MVTVRWASAPITLILTCSTPGLELITKIRPSSAAATAVGKAKSAWLTRIPSASASPPGSPSVVTAPVVGSTARTTWFCSSATRSPHRELNDIPIG